MGWRLTNSRERIVFLHEASTLLASSLDYENNLAKLAELTVRDLADWCAVDLVEAGGALRRASVAHVDPAKQVLARTLERWYRPDPRLGWGPFVVVQTGKAQWLSDVKDPIAAALSVDPQHLRILSELGLGSVACVPLTSPDGRQGALTAVQTNPNKAYGASEIAMLRTLGRRAGIAVLHGRLYAKLQAMNRAKDEFMAMLGHELRNPIAAIANAVSALEQLGTPSEQERRLRGIIARQAHHLVRLLDDLLDLTRLTSGRITLQRQSADLQEIANRCLATLDASGKAERHDIVLSTVPAFVEGDPARLEQVLGNLLDNAVKYTPPGGRIDVMVEEDDSAAVLRVRDTGIGIAPEALPRIFNMFHQEGRALDREHGGLGLGLTLVRRLVELHGGTVEASSPGLGHGTEVVVRLPLRSNAHPAPPQVQAAHPAPAPRRHVLVIEDNPDAREALLHLLRTFGHRVEVAEDGGQGIELALRARPDVALIDIGLPGIDGYEVARRVRAGNQGRDMCLIALTGYGQPADRARSLAAGFDAHLVKPVDADELARVLTSVAPKRDRRPLLL